MMKAAAWHPDIGQGIPGVVVRITGSLLNRDRTAWPHETK